MSGRIRRLFGRAKARLRTYIGKENGTTENGAVIRKLSISFFRHVWSYAATAWPSEGQTGNLHCQGKRHHGNWRRDQETVDFVLSPCLVVCGKMLGPARARLGTYIGKENGTTENGAVTRKLSISFCRHVWSNAAKCLAQRGPDWEPPTLARKTAPRKMVP